MSLVMKGDSFGELGPGDLQMLLLRLDGEDNVDENETRHQTLRVIWFRWSTPQRPPLQRAVLHRVGSFQDCVRGRGQTHAGGSRGSEVGPGRAQPEPVQTLPDWVILYQQVQGVTGAVNKIVHLNQGRKRRLLHNTEPITACGKQDTTAWNFKTKQN